MYTSMYRRIQALADLPSFDYILSAKQRGNALGGQHFRDYNIQEHDIRACVIDNYRSNHENQVRITKSSPMHGVQPTTDIRIRALHARQALHWL